MGGDAAVIAASIDETLSAVVALRSSPDWLKPGSKGNRIGEDQGGDSLYESYCPARNVEAFAHQPALCFICGDRWDSLGHVSGSSGSPPLTCAPLPRPARAPAATSTCLGRARSALSMNSSQGCTRTALTRPKWSFSSQGGGTGTCSSGARRKGAVLVAGCAHGPPASRCRPGIPKVQNEILMWFRRHLDTISALGAAGSRLGLLKDTSTMEPDSDWDVIEDKHLFV